jgi:pyrroline-5-carboxylate reductase
MSIALSGSLVLVGAGKMGGAMLEGWLRSGVPGGQIVALDPAASDDMKTKLANWGIRLNPPPSAVKAPEVLLVAVKPQILEEVLPQLEGFAIAKPLIISVVAGKTIAAFARHFGSHAAIIRTIPNTPAAIGRGITAMVANANVSSAQQALAAALLSSIGEVVTVPKEGDIDSVTAVSGSGPAYVFYMTECLAKAGERLGLAPDIAMQLARATVSGAGELMRVTGTEASTLRENVTSPKGTTYAALQVLMAEGGLEPLMTRAVKAACDRSKELAG